MLILQKVVTFARGSNIKRPIEKINKKKNYNNQSLQRKPQRERFSLNSTFGSTKYKSMSNQIVKKPFIPRNKPKSWIIFICGGFIGLLVASPLAVLGIILNFWFLKVIGTVLFFACGCTMATMFVVGAINRFSGNWKKLEEKDWKDQVW